MVLLKECINTIGRVGVAAVDVLLSALVHRWQCCSEPVVLPESASVSVGRVDAAVGIAKESGRSMGRIFVACGIDSRAQHCRWPCSGCRWCC